MTVEDKLNLCSNWNLFHKIIQTWDNYEKLQIHRVQYAFQNFWEVSFSYNSKNGYPATLPQLRLTINVSYDDIREYKINQILDDN